MSHDQGRPSLFAGMEDGASPGSDTQRVRILSTLESTRRSNRPARKGPRPLERSQSAPLDAGQSRAWAITLGLGAVTLLISFILIIQDQRHPPLKSVPDTQAAAPTASAVITPSLAISPPLTEATPPEAAASVATEMEPLDTLPPTAANNTPATSGDPMAALVDAKGAHPAVTPGTTESPSPSKARPATMAKTARPAKASKSGRNDQDVDLIEAVMSHGSSRPGSR